MLLKHKSARWTLGLIAAFMLLLTYVFQRLDFSHFIGIESAYGRFIFNRSLRFLLNDLSCLLLITAVFNKKSYLRLSAWLFVVESVIILPLYFLVKLSWEGDSEISSPLLSQWHRMIVNPLLMIVLMVGFFYQDFFSKPNHA